MKKRMLAIFAMIALTFAFGVGSALAAHEADGPDQDSKACQKDDPPAPCDPEWKSDHEHDDDDEGNEGDEDDGESQCDQLAAIEGPLNDNGVPTDGAIVDGCKQLENAIAGDGGDEGDDDDEGDEGDEGDGESQCDQLNAIEGPLNDNGVPTEGAIVDGCTQLEGAITDNLPV